MKEITPDIRYSEHGLSGKPECENRCHMEE